MKRKKILLTQPVKRYLHRIVDKAGRIPERLPSEAELMDRFGISRITVRRALEELLEEGYVIRQKDRKGLFTNPRHSLNIQYIIGFVVHGRQSLFHSGYSSLISAGFSIEMGGLRYQREMLTLPEEMDENFAATLKDTLLDALLWIIPDDRDIPVINQMLRKQYPVITVLSPYLDTNPLPSGNFVRFDFAQKGACWAKFFLDRGLKNPVYCGGTKERIEGFRKMLWTHGILLPDAHVIPEQENLPDLLEERFRSDSAIDGLVADGTVYFPVLEFLKRKPERAKLPVLFDGDAMAQELRFANPALNIHSVETTYYQTGVKAGRTAAKMLLECFRSHGQIQKGKSIKWF